jgi:small conductance mechanosensitive channel
MVNIIPINPFNIKNKMKGIKGIKGIKSISSMKMLKQKYLIHGILGIVALIISHIAVSFISKKIVEATNNKNIDENIKNSTAFHMMQSTIYWVLMSICVIVILSFTDIQGAAVIAILGSLLFAIGLGLQGTLGDLAAGMMLIIGNVYKIGDYIEVLDVGNNTCVGIVNDFNVMYTRILDDDTSVILNVPNRVIYNNIVKNHSNSTKRVVVEEIVVSNRNKNLSIGLEKIKEYLQNSQFVINDPPVATNISSVTENGTKIEVRYAIKSTDYFTSGTKNIQGILMTSMRQILVDNGVDLVVRG